MTTGSNSFDLKRLVAEAVLLKPITSRPDDHPVGFGLRSTHAFNLGHGVGKLKLPKLPHETVEELRQQIHGVEVPGIPEDLVPAAWNALLGSPGLTVSLRRPSYEEALNSGLIVPESRLNFVRAVGLAVVVRETDLQFIDGTIASSPVAGVAEVLLETKENAPQVSANASISPSWTTSTTRFSNALQQLYLKIASSKTASTSASRVGFIIDEEYFSLLSIEEQERIKVNAAIHKHELKFHAYSAKNHGAINNTLRRQPPSSLMISTANTRAARELIETFKAATEKGRFFKLTGSAYYDLNAEICEVLCGISGVSTGLLPIRLVVEQEDDSGQRPLNWLGKRFARERRHGSFGRIRECAEEGFWYVRDFGDHAESKYKRYVLIERTFVHDADLDLTGSVIPKFKGEYGRDINWNDTWAI
jgi:hypothetical protein